jgi:hypothetical protein
VARDTARAHRVTFVITSSAPNRLNQLGKPNPLIPSFLTTMAIPDADINPTATGEALKTAKEHEQPAEVTFYAGELFRGCVRIRETLKQMERMVLSIRASGLDRT